MGLFILAVVKSFFNNVLGVKQFSGALVRALRRAPFRSRSWVARSNQGSLAIVSVIRLKGASAPFVLASRQKYTMEPRTLRCRICFVTHRYNNLRVYAEGHLNAPIENKSEHSSPLSGSLKLSQPI
jgi:hypothetical protein